MKQCYSTELEPEKLTKLINPGGLLTPPSAQQSWTFHHLHSMWITTLRHCDSISFQGRCNSHNSARVFNGKKPSCLTSPKPIHWIIFPGEYSSYFQDCYVYPISYIHHISTCINVQPYLFHYWIQYWQHKLLLYLPR